MIAHMLNIAVGLTFSGGFLDLFLFGILQGNAKTDWFKIVIVGVIYFILYYVTFSFLIKKIDLKTPGREDDDQETKLYRKADYLARKNGSNDTKENVPTDEKSDLIMKGLGGKANISDVDCCATRLRVTVNKPELVNQSILKSTGCSGVVQKGNGVQVIYGPGVTVIKANLEDYLESQENVEYISENREDTAASKETDTVANDAAQVEKTIVIGSPLNGICQNLSEVPDEAFAGGMMGEGACMIPEDPYLYAPTDGEVTFVFDTKHAIGFQTDTGISMLFHMGIDTVKLDGQGFEVLVENGQKVKKGDPLLKMDLEFIKKNAPSISSPILCTDLDDNMKVRLLKTGNVQKGEDIIAVDILA
jgi:PTS system D-glucosamine-specific IIC component